MCHKELLCHREKQHAIQHLLFCGPNLEFQVNKFGANEGSVFALTNRPDEHTLLVQVSVSLLLMRCAASIRHGYFSASTVLPESQRMNRNPGKTKEHLFVDCSLDGASVFIHLPIVV